MRKRFYLAKHAGSNDVVYDFSNAEIVEEKDLLSKMPEFMDVEKAEFVYRFYDSRVKFHAWCMVAPYKDGSFGGSTQQFCWIYSTSRKQPYISEFEE